MHLESNPNSPQGCLCHTQLEPRKRRVGDLSKVTCKCQSWALNPCCVVSPSVSLIPYVVILVRLGRGSQPMGFRSRYSKASLKVNI